jgi:pimeloyl-ACP methyl ester carboxylesterase
MIPETRYARAGDIHIAYQLLGEGRPVDVVLADMWFSNMDGQWDVPPLAAFRRRLASFSRLIMFDRRGMGLSDPVAIQSLPSLDAWMDDLRAVMSAARSERAALIANIGGAITSLVFAASHPDRLGWLVVVDGFARVRSAPDYPAGMPDERVERDPIDAQICAHPLLTAGAAGLRRTSKSPTATTAWIATTAQARRLRSPERAASPTTRALAANERTTPAMTPCRIGPSWSSRRNHATTP